MIKELDTQQIDFNSKLQQLISFDNAVSNDIINTVNTILNDIKDNKDKAVIKYSNKFDNLNITDIKEIIINENQLKKAFNDLTKQQKEALRVAKKRIENYHKKQKQTSWDYIDDTGTMLGQKITPIEKVGLYVPGGKASYPSSVLMNAIPAKIAGVKELIMVVPTPNKIINKLVLAAAYLVGVDKVFTIGGAQAIGALAYGTQTIPKVNKIVGPGNIFVATAKRAVFGITGIDMIAGPSEILIICDGKANPDWIAMDLFSQAEHDENAQSILLSPSIEFINKVKNSITKLLPNMARKAIISKALKNRGALILTKDINDAINIANEIAPEHLELAVQNPQELLKDIINAGAIFMGYNSCESLGDYCAGPNHVLPTSGTAKFSSALGVEDFYKKSSIIMASTKGANELGQIAITLADAEGLDAHAKSAYYRMNL